MLYDHSQTLSSAADTPVQAVCVCVCEEWLQAVIAEQPPPFLCDKPSSRVLHLMSSPRPNLGLPVSTFPVPGVCGLLGGGGAGLHLLQKLHVWTHVAVNV